ncbi:MAG TPA: alanine--glyoxylate aminotransferase family protein [Methylomirabilota bacterium]|jgi:aspartate aminotransferase-like enzyme|nr:alanine--glyoxylate aminotransferase family protein [Methylomirabilota bacterium]
MKKYYLMAPGPTPVPSNVLLAMAQEMIHHRTPEYEALFIEVRAGLQRLFQTSRDVIPFTSSGTGAMEAAVVNTLSPGDAVLVLRAGKFGERWEEICHAYGVRVIPVTAPFGETVPAERIAGALREHPEAKAVLMQHSESSTGVLHDVKGIAAVSRATNAILIVDAVSSLGIADLRMDAWGVDLVVAGSQKGLMLPPGLCFCALSEKAWERLGSSRLPKYYFDLAAEWKAVSKNEAHFTPAVSIVVGLREVLRMIEAEGLPNVFKRHERLARATRSGVEALGLEIFAKATPSPALTAVVAPRGLDSEQIVAAYSVHNITIAGGQGEMKGRVFRLGHMGYVGDFDVLTALGALEQVLHELGHPVDFGAAVRGAQKVFAAERV